MSSNSGFSLCRRNPQTRIFPKWLAGGSSERVEYIKGKIRKRKKKIKMNILPSMYRKHLQNSHLIHTHCNSSQQSNSISNSPDPSPQGHDDSPRMREHSVSWLVVVVTGTLVGVVHVAQAHLLSASWELPVKLFAHTPTRGPVGQNWGAQKSFGVLGELVEEVVLLLEALQKFLPLLPLLSFPRPPSLPVSASRDSRSLVVGCISNSQTRIAAVHRTSGERYVDDAVVRCIQTSSWDY